MMMNFIEFVGIHAPDHGAKLQILKHFHLVINKI